MALRKKKWRAGRLVFLCRIEPFLKRGLHLKGKAMRRIETVEFRLENKWQKIKNNRRLSSGLRDCNISVLGLAAVKEIKFPYADMHGNLKVVLNTPISGPKGQNMEFLKQNLNFQSLRQTEVCYYLVCGLKTICDPKWAKILP